MLNFTSLFVLQNAYQVLFNLMLSQSDSQSACVIFNYDSNHMINDFYLENYPTNRIGCTESFEKFVDGVRAGASQGCAFFIIDNSCLELFLDNFREIHDWIEQRYLSKYVVIVGDSKGFEQEYINQVFKHPIIDEDLPRTVLLSENYTTKSIDIWSSYPFNDYYSNSYDRFFWENSTFLNGNSIFPVMDNFFGRPITIAMINYPPYTYYRFVPPGTGNANQVGVNKTLNLYIDGQECLMMLEICKIYNCSINIQFEEEGLWGESFHNHTGYGLVGALIDRRADIAIGAMYLWWPTLEFAIYSLPIQGASVVMIVPKPLPLPHILTPILPFPPIVWVLVLTTVLMAIFMFHKTVNQQAEVLNENKMSLFDSGFNVLMLSMFQPVTVEPRLPSFVIVFTLLGFLCLICDNLYTGGLASIMTVTRFEEPIDTLNKLVHSKLLWGSNAECWLFSVLGSDIPEFQIFVKGYKIYSAEDLVRLEEQRKLAVVLEVLQAGYLCYKECLNRKISEQYMVMKEELYWQTTQIYSTKTWPYMEQMNGIITHVAQSGLAQYWEYRAASRTMDYNIQRNIDENGNPPEGDDPVRLSIEHVLGEIIILGLGYILSVICFILEIIFHHYQKKKFKRSQVGSLVRVK